LALIQFFAEGGAGEGGRGEEGEGLTLLAAKHPTSTEAINTTTQTMIVTAVRQPVKIMFRKTLGFPLGFRVYGLGFRV
jgi:hypothetical protein